ncbi:restriction endonuclease subunit S [Marinimicrobium locisalis]|uniref:restriction endonuclease subunit S n=1 Tax=Marinimicrobium locisalis TaxID=546022 RepID=UPI003221AF83
MMGSQNLPAGWTKTELGNVVQYGKSEKCVLADVDDNTWVLELEDIEKGSSRLVSRKTAKDRPFKSTKNRFRRGCVLYGKLRPYLNKVVLADQSGVCTTEIIPLDAEPLSLNRYLFHWLRTNEFLSYVNSVSYGVNMPRLGTKDGMAAPFALAPLAEQIVIADKLDTLLAQVEATKARLERIPKILKRFRQSVLAAAVTGRLTEDWRKTWEEQAERKKGVAEHYQVDDEYQFAVPDTWQLTAMGNVSKFQQGLQIAKNTRRLKPGKDILPILRTVNYENNFKENVHYASVSEKSIIAEPEDIILSRTGTVGLVLTGFKGIMHNNSFRLNFQKELLLGGYLIFYLKSPACQEYIKKESGRSSQPDLTHKAFSKCPISVPGILEQREIFHRVTQLFAEADSIEKQSNNALARVRHLTQSILAKAFRGELTEQWRKDNPDLISGENSAEVLLRKIQAEREC